MRARWTTLLTVGLILFGVAGCAIPTPEPMEQRLHRLDLVSKREPEATYVVEIPDLITIEAWGEPEISQTVRVRQDGCVTLPLLADVKVAGLTTAEISDKLEDLYSEFLQEPQILVALTSNESKRVFIYGEAGRGEVQYTGGQTAAKLIKQVGFNQHSDLKRVQVIRGDWRKPEIYHVNVDAILRNGKTDLDVSLAPNDVIYVPPTFSKKCSYVAETVLMPIRALTGLISGPAAVQSAAVPYYVPRSSSQTTTE